MDKDHKVKRKYAYAIALLALVFVIMALSTYSWFTTQVIEETVIVTVPGDEGNQLVDTSTASGKSNDQNINLLLSTEGGEAFDGKVICDIKQINVAKLDKIMPVSTADLTNFVGNSRTVDDKTVNLARCDESKLFHGRVYVKATGNGFDENTRIKLYLDKADGEIFNADGEVLNAARLGLKVDDNAPLIIRTSENHNDSEHQINNTYIDGKQVESGSVLSIDNTDKISAVKDPSISMADVSLNSNDEMLVIPANEIAEIELNKICMIDVYFYLEGCDVDCHDFIALSKMDMKLSFFGVVSKKGN